MHSRARERFARVTSLLTLAFFLFNQVTFAYPGAGIEMAPPRELPSFLQIDIPSDLASLDGIYEAPPRPDPKFILHIQNAHANYGAQQKIKGLLQYLEKTYAIKTIFVEGASEDLNPDYLKMFPDKERNLKLAQFLAEQGELTGAELYLLEADNASHGPWATSHENAEAQSVSRVPNDVSRAVKAHGIENAELYRENYEALKKVFGSEVTVKKYLTGFEGRLSTLASKVFSKDMLRLLAEWKKFEKGHREFMPYVKSLAAEAKRVLGVDLESLFAQIEWPQVTRLLVLQSMEKELDTVKGLAERDRLIQFLKEKKVSGKMIAAIENFKDQRMSVMRGTSDGQAGPLESRDLMEQLVTEAGPKGFRFSDYPHFSLYAGYLILKSEMDPKGLFDEIKLLFTRILDTLAQTSHSNVVGDRTPCKHPVFANPANTGCLQGGCLQKALLELYRNEELVRKLLNLELTRKDWQEVLRRREPQVPASVPESQDSGLGKEDSLLMDAMVSELKRIGTSVSQEFNLPLSSFETKPVNPKFRQAVTEVQEAAYKFYDAARKREDVFYEKIDTVMRKDSLTKAVLITGGFHTDGITELLREHEVSYGVLTPRLSEKSDENLYRNVMLQNKPSTFELSYLEQALGHTMSATAENAQVGDGAFLNVLRSELRAAEAVSGLPFKDNLTILNDSPAFKARGIQINSEKIGKPVYRVVRKKGSDPLKAFAPEDASVQRPVAERGLTPFSPGLPGVLASRVEIRDALEEIAGNTMPGRAEQRILDAATKLNEIGLRSEQRVATKEVGTALAPLTLGAVKEELNLLSRGTGQNSAQLAATIAEAMKSGEQALRLPEGRSGQARETQPTTRAETRQEIREILTDAQGDDRLPKIDFQDPIEFFKQVEMDPARKASLIPLVAFSRATVKSNFQPTKIEEIIHAAYDPQQDSEIVVLVVKSSNAMNGYAYDLLTIDLQTHRLVASSPLKIKEKSEITPINMQTYVKGHGYMERSLRLLFLTGKIRKQGSDDTILNDAAKMYDRMAQDPRFFVVKVENKELGAESEKESPYRYAIYLANENTRNLPSAIKVLEDLKKLLALPSMSQDFERLNRWIGGIEDDMDLQCMMEANEFLKTLRLETPSRKESRSEVHFSREAQEGIARLADQILLDIAFDLRNVGSYGELDEKLNAAWSELGERINRAMDALPKKEAVDHESLDRGVDGFAQVMQPEALDAFRTNREESVRIIRGYIGSFGLNLPDVVLLIQLINRRKFGMMKDFSKDYSLSDWERQQKTRDRLSGKLTVNHWKSSVFRMSSKSIDLYASEMASIQNSLKGMWREEFFGRKEGLSETENNSRERMGYILRDNLNHQSDVVVETQNMMFGMLKNVLDQMTGPWNKATLPGDVYKLEEFILTKYSTALENERIAQRDIGLVMNGMLKNDSGTVAEAIRDIVRTGPRGDQIQQQAEKTFETLGIPMDRNEVVFVDSDSDIATVLFSGTNHLGKHIDLGDNKSLILVRTKFGLFADVETLAHELLHKGYRSNTTSGTQQVMKALSLIIEEAYVAKKSVEQTRRIIEEHQGDEGAKRAWLESTEQVASYPLEQKLLAAITSRLDPAKADTEVDRFLTDGNVSSLNFDTGMLESMNNFINRFATNTHNSDALYVIALMILTQALTRADQFKQLMESGEAICQVMKQEPAIYTKIDLNVAYQAGKKIVEAITATPQADLQATVELSFADARKETTSLRAETRLSELREGQVAVPETPAVPNFVAGDEIAETPASETPEAKPDSPTLETRRSESREELPGVKTLAGERIAPSEPTILGLVLSLAEDHLTDKDRLTGIEKDLAGVLGQALLPYLANLTYLTHQTVPAKVPQSLLDSEEFKKTTITPLELDRILSGLTSKLARAMEKTGFLKTETHASAFAKELADYFFKYGYIPIREGRASEYPLEDDSKLKTLRLGVGVREGIIFLSDPEKTGATVLVDQNPFVIDVLNQFQSRVKNNRARVIAADISSPDFPGMLSGETFDRIVLSRVLHEVGRTQTALRESDANLESQTRISDPSVVKARGNVYKIFATLLSDNGKGIIVELQPPKGPSAFNYTKDEINRTRGLEVLDEESGEAHIFSKEEGKSVGIKTTIVFRKKTVEGRRSEMRQGPNPHKTSRALLWEQRFKKWLAVGLAGVLLAGTVAFTGYFITSPRHTTAPPSVTAAGAFDFTKYFVKSPSGITGIVLSTEAPNNDDHEVNENEAVIFNINTKETVGSSPIRYGQCAYGLMLPNGGKGLVAMAHFSPNSDKKENDWNITVEESNRRVKRFIRMSKERGIGHENSTAHLFIHGPSTMDNFSTDIARALGAKIINIPEDFVVLVEDGKIIIQDDDVLSPKTLGTADIGKNGELINGTGVLSGISKAVSSTGEGPGRSEMRGFGALKQYVATGLIAGMLMGFAVFVDRVAGAMERPGAPVRGAFSQGNVGFKSVSSQEIPQGFTSFYDLATARQQVLEEAWKELARMASDGRNPDLWILLSNPAWKDHVFVSPNTTDRPKGGAGGMAFPQLVAVDQGALDWVMSDRASAWDIFKETLLHELVHATHFQLGKNWGREEENRTRVETAEFFRETFFVYTYPAGGASAKVESYSPVSRDYTRPQKLDGSVAVFSISASGMINAYPSQNIPQSAIDEARRFLGRGLVRSRSEVRKAKAAGEWGTQEEGLTEFEDRVSSLPVSKVDKLSFFLGDLDKIGATNLTLGGKAIVGTMNLLKTLEHYFAPKESPYLKFLEEWESILRKNYGVTVYRGVGGDEFFIVADENFNAKLLDKAREEFTRAFLGRYAVFRVKKMFTAEEAKFLEEDPLVLAAGARGNASYILIDRRGLKGDDEAWMDLLDNLEDGLQLEDNELEEIQFENQAQGSERGFFSLSGGVALAGIVREKVIDVMGKDYWLETIDDVERFRKDKAALFVYIGQNWFANDALTNAKQTGRNKISVVKPGRLHSEITRDKILAAAEEIQNKKLYPTADHLESKDPRSGLLNGEAGNRKARENADSIEEINHLMVLSYIDWVVKRAFHYVQSKPEIQYAGGDKIIDKVVEIFFRLYGIEANETNIERFKKGFLGWREGPDGLFAVFMKGAKRNRGPPPTAGELDKAAEELGATLNTLLKEGTATPPKLALIHVDSDALSNVRPTGDGISDHFSNILMAEEGAALAAWVTEAMKSVAGSAKEREHLAKDLAAAMDVEEGKGGSLILKFNPKKIKKLYGLFLKAQDEQAEDGRVELEARYVPRDELNMDALKRMVGQYQASSDVAAAQDRMKRVLRKRLQRDPSLAEKISAASEREQNPAEKATFAELLELAKASTDKRSEMRGTEPTAIEAGLAQKFETLKGTTFNALRDIVRNLGDRVNQLSAETRVAALTWGLVRLGDVKAAIRVLGEVAGLVSARTMTGLISKLKAAVPNVPIEINLEKGTVARVLKGFGDEQFFVDAFFFNLMLNPNTRFHFLDFGDLTEVAKADRIRGMIFERAKQLNMPEIAGRVRIKVIAPEKAKSKEVGKFFSAIRGSYVLAGTDTAFGMLDLDKVNVPQLWESQDVLGNIGVLNASCNAALKVAGLASFPEMIKALEISNNLGFKFNPRTHRIEINPVSLGMLKNLSILFEAFQQISKAA